MTIQQYTDEMLNTYRLVTVLSQRNDCRILRLRHKELNRDLVLHQLPKHIDSYEKLCDLRCENLPEIYDSVLLEDGQIVLEEFIEGVTVAQVLETETYSYKSAKKIMIGLCNALTILHERGIVHRDIKPENVIIDRDGRAVLIDLNISRIEKETKKDTVIMGTVGYASPEQLGIAQSDARTDVYAAGVFLNVMLTGKHPSETVAKGRAGRIVKKCTNITPGLRYQTAKKLANSL